MHYQYSRKELYACLLVGGIFLSFECYQCMKWKKSQYLKEYILLELRLAHIRYSGYIVIRWYLFKTSGLINKESICVAWGAESMNLNAIYVLFETFGRCVMNIFLSSCLLNDMPVLCGSIHFHNYNGLYCILTFLFMLSWVMLFTSYYLKQYCRIVT